MKILIISKATSKIDVLTNITSITYTNGAYVIGGTSYSADDYVIFIQN